MERRGRKIRRKEAPLTREAVITRELSVWALEYDREVQVLGIPPEITQPAKYCLTCGMVIVFLLEELPGIQKIQKEVEKTLTFGKFAVYTLKLAFQVKLVPHQWTFLPCSADFWDQYPMVSQTVIRKSVSIITSHVLDLEDLP